MTEGPAETPQQIMSPEQMDAARQYEATLMRNFQMELGRMAGQAVVDKTQFEARENALIKERDQLREALDELSQRLASLEGSFPDEQGNAQSSGEEATSLTPPSAPVVRKKAKR